MDRVRVCVHVSVCVHGKKLSHLLEYKSYFPQNKLIIWISFGVFMRRFKAIVQMDTHSLLLSVCVCVVLNFGYIDRVSPTTGCMNGYVCLLAEMVWKLWWSRPTTDMMKFTRNNRKNTHKHTHMRLEQAFQTLSNNIHHPFRPDWWCLLNSIFYTFIHLQWLWCTPLVATAMQLTQCVCVCVVCEWMCCEWKCA